MDLAVVFSELTSEYSSCTLNVHVRCGMR